MEFHVHDALVHIFELVKTLSFASIYILRGTVKVKQAMGKESEEAKSQCFQSLSRASLGWPVI